MDSRRFVPAHISFDRYRKTNTVMETNDIISLNNKTLIDILRNYRRHPDEDVKAAYLELKRRGIVDEVVEALRDEVRDGKLEIKNENNNQNKPEFNLARPKIFRIGSTQQVVFEQRLIAEGIPYFRREGLDVIVPLVNYYFADQDFEIADQIEVETHDYVQQLPPDKRSKVTKRAGKAFLWVGIFFAAFLLFSLIIRYINEGGF